MHRSKTRVCGLQTSIVQLYKHPLSIQARLGYHADIGDRQPQASPAGRASSALPPVGTMALAYRIIGKATFSPDISGRAADRRTICRSSPATDATRGENIHAGV
jgi:hypothetical protein